MLKRLGALLLVLALLAAVCIGCGKAPEEPASEPESDDVGESSLPGDDSTTGGENILITTAGSNTDADIITTAADSDSTAGNKKTTAGNNKTTKNNGGKTTAKATTKTKATTTAPKNAPTIVTTTTKKKIELPAVDVDYSKKLSVCIDWDPKNSWVQTWEKCFRACYDPDEEIKIEYKIATPSVKASKLAVWKSGNQSPDCIYIKPEESWPNLINKGLAEAVDGMTDLSAGYWESVKPIMDTLKINGKNYVLVSSAYSSGAVIYNPKTIKNAGLTDPRDLLYKNEWTWDKFEEYAKKMTKLNATDASKSSYGVFFHYYEGFLFGGGKDIIEYKDNKWVSNLGDKSFATAIEYLRKMGDTGNKYTLTGESDMTTVRNKLINGTLGLYVTMESPALEFTGGELVKDTLRYVPIPRKTDMKTYYVGGVVDGWLICKGAKNPEGGLAYATAVRALNTLNLDVDAAADKETTPEQKYCNEYAESIMTVVPMQFRRLESVIHYWDVYGNPVKEGASWAAHIAEWEPKIMEALAKE